VPGVETTALTSAPTAAIAAMTSATPIAATISEVRIS
jgi:hypothetical protein